MCFGPHQGSTGDEGSEWVDLRRHIMDGTIRKPGQMASWPVLGPQASVPFRVFRLMLEGPTPAVAGSACAADVGSGGSSVGGGSAASYNFSISNLELYGYLHIVGHSAATTVASSASTNIHER